MLFNRLGGIEMAIDLLEELSSIKPKIGLYSPIELKRDINKWAKECKSLLVIDEIEPLLDTWSMKDKNDFFKLMAKWRTECVVLIVSRLGLLYESLLGKNRVFNI
jgi:hypothetical protein